MIAWEHLSRAARRRQGAGMAAGLAGLLCLAGFTTARASEAFLPPNATVLLVSGLPGDLENETSYRQQLQGWLEWLGAVPAPPARVFVLADDVGKVTAESKLPVQTMTANREQFLALGPKLAGLTNPFVAIVWGHGGMQGKTPVFHVRGPRITPADMKGVAEQSKGAPAHWALFFRSSGSFAAELSGAGRKIVSSENSVVFQSDPIGLPLLLQAARGGANNSFAAVAEELGRATVNWYESRHLARTEEPTLWLPGAEPRRLASEDKGGSLASVPERKKETPETKDSPAQEAPPGELPTVWKSITRVDARQHPEADAVVLRRRVSFTLGSKPAISSENEEFVQILTVEGKEAGDFDLAYSPPQEELTILDCEVLRPDGKLIRVPTDDIREAGETPVGDYRTARRKFFSMPGIGPGAVLHLRYRTEWQTYPMPHVSLRLPLAAELPVLSATLQVSVPKDSPFHFTFDHAKPADPTIQQTTHGTSYTWQFDHTPALPAEMLAPPDHRPALLLSTWPDWAAFADWYVRISRLTDELTPELTEKARELTRDARTDREKVVALYNYVTRLRYVMVPLGVNSFRPHAAANVFKNQFGDCKDKANLFNTLLHAVGIDACLVLVPRFSQAHEAVPGLAFNHAISRVMLGGEPIYVDTTDDVCRFGMLPPGDPGRQVLVIDGKSARLTQLPVPAPKDHRVEIRTELQCAPRGEPSPVTFEIKATGFPDYDLRGAAGAAKAHRQNAPLLTGKFRLAAGSFTLKRQAATPASQLEEDFTWQANGACIGLFALAGDRWLIRAPVWLPAEWDLALQPRTLPLFLHHGYPLNLSQEIEITLPAASKQLLLPPLFEHNHEPLRWRIEWSQAGDGRLKVKVRLELMRGELDPAATVEFQKQFTRFLTLLANGATFAAP